MSDDQRLQAERNAMIADYSRLFYLFFCEHPRRGVSLPRSDHVVVQQTPLSPHVPLRARVLAKGAWVAPS